MRIAQAEYQNETGQKYWWPLVIATVQFETRVITFIAKIKRLATVKTVETVIPTLESLIEPQPEKDNWWRVNFVGIQLRL